MRIAFLCKRQYMGKDVIVDRYARLYELPFQLARLGHEVLGICLSYQGHAEGQWSHEASPGTLSWESRTAPLWHPTKLLRHPGFTLSRLRKFRPDIVVGASDIPHVVLGAWLAGQLEVPYVADLYDNFEGFGQARIPGMKALLRRAVRRAALITTTSEPLASFVRNQYRPMGDVVPMPSTVDKSVFCLQDRAACRRKLGLPVQARLVGTAGGLHRDKGVDVLYEAWQQLAATAPDIHLVLAGPHDPSFPPPAGSRVHYLGEIPHAQTAELFAALDVGVIYVRDTPFGRYCFPQKAYEMLACGLPVVAARVGAMADLFAMSPQSLYLADDAPDLAMHIRQQLESPINPAVAIIGWAEIIRDLEPRLQAILNCKLA